MFALSETATLSRTCVCSQMCACIHDYTMQIWTLQRVMAKKRDPLTQVHHTPRSYCTPHTFPCAWLLQVLFRDHLLKTLPDAALVQPFWFACMKELRALLSKRTKESTFLHNLLVMR